MKNLYLAFNHVLFKLRNRFLFRSHFRKARKQIQDGINEDMFKFLTKHE